MGLEIREVIIKSVVEPENTSERGENATSQHPDQEEVIRACVEQVMEIIKKKNYR